MPESTILCIDTSEYTRNMDFGGVSRLVGITEACNLIAGAKLQMNPENTIGFLTMGGARCQVHESLTTDFDRMLASLTVMRTDGTLHFVEGLRIGALALAHRVLNRGEKRLIALVASPIHIEEDTLVKLARKLRKDEIAVDVINIGHEENATVLRTFVETVNKNGNSTLVQVVAPMSIPDFVLSTSIVSMGGSAGSASRFEFGVDANLDPELAMVLRQSAEEERLRQEALAATEGGSVQDAAHGVRGSHAEPTTRTANGREWEQEDLDDDMDEELRLALELSRQDAQGLHADATTSRTEGNAVVDDDNENEDDEEVRRALLLSRDEGDVEDVFDEVVTSSDFLQELAKEAGVSTETMEEQIALIRKRGDEKHTPKEDSP